jgi:hypothetical protein
MKILDINLQRIGWMKQEKRSGTGMGRVGCDIWNKNKKRIRELRIR